MVSIFSRVFSLLGDYLLAGVSVLLSLIILCFTPIFTLVGLVRNKTFKDPNNVVITGASSGIGYNLALYYSKPGVTLSLFGRNEAQLTKVKNECEAKGAKVEINIADVTDRNTMKKYLLDFDNRKPVDLLIANAGIIESQLPSTLDFEAKTHLLTETNVGGMLNTILPLIPRFEQRRSGQIVLTSSLSMYMNFFFAAYSASKSFITSYGSNLRKHMESYGVGVTVLVPGFITTPMTESFKRKNLMFCLNVDQASKIIGYGIRHNHAQVSFPFPTFALGVLFSIVPPNLRDSFSYCITPLIKDICFFDEADKKKQN